MSAQRFRVFFRKGERVRYISHLDVLRFWERAIRRAGLPLSYSQGFTPHPKIAFAGPLPLGFTSEAELMDVSLDERVDVAEFRRRLEAETTEDLGVVDVEEVAVNTPAPQAQVLWADYRVDLPDADLGEATAAVTKFLANTSFRWSEERREKSRTFDLRQAVALLAAEAVDGAVRLRMRLQTDQEITVRPEQLVAAILPAVEAPLYTRTGLVLASSSPAREAWRRRGQYEP